MRATALVLATVLALPASLDAAAADDRHAEYYYPEPSVVESYGERVRTLPEANRRRRVALVTALATAAINAEYAPLYTLFAKGDEAQKLIIVALQDGPMDTLYRARAVMAMMTSVARTLPMLSELGAVENYTFLDLLKLMGFTQVTVSDGRDFAYQILIE